MTTMKNGEQVDMSPSAIAARLDEVRALYRLTSYLVRFRPVGAPKPPSTR
jgi:hypothetical protein